MSRETLSKALVNLGLSEVASEVYVFLAQAGPQKARTIANQLGVYKQQVYRSLKNLQSKGMATATAERPAHFSAVSLEKVLDAIIEATKEEAEKVAQNKDEILSSWQALLMEDVAI